MATIHELKETEATGTPVLLFECLPPAGGVERWSTYRVEFDGHVWEPRVVRHNLFDMRSGSDEGWDGNSKISIVVSNADSRCSQIERGGGWKGAELTVRFAFFDLAAGGAVSEAQVVFRGAAEPPEETTEAAMRLSFSNRLSLRRVLLPEVRIQRRCPWVFPMTAEQRAEAAEGGARGKYSRFYRCGYSPEIEGGRGNLDGGAAHAGCGFTKADCAARGMYGTDSAGRATRRFGGLGFLPPGIDVRGFGEKGSHRATAVENEARYDDFVPLVYGTAWYQPPVIFARNDGNLTHMEALLGLGVMNSVLKVVVKDIEIPQGRAGANMTATGWYNIANYGHRTGEFNLDFRDGAGQPLGDPCGSMAVLSVVVPNRVSDGESLPRLRVLAEGLVLERFDASGAPAGEAFTNNPAWVLLDVFRRSGWPLEDVDVASFAAAAAYCGETVEATDIYGNAVEIPRYQCNLAVRKRQSAADVVRGIRAACGLMATVSASGKLQLRAESTVAIQQPVKPAGSNAAQPLNGGWPAYEFGDGQAGSGGVLRRDNGEPAVRLWSRGSGDTANRLSVEFQDAFNEYQQDSLSLVDIEDVIRTGREVAGTSPMAGIPNFDQAARALRRQLDKAIQGNTYLEFETSVKGFGLRPGDIITFTYLKEGFSRQPFRILKVAPGNNYQTAAITAQIHSDEWYVRAAGENPGGRRRPAAEVGLPRPLAGSAVEEDGEPSFAVSERMGENADGSVRVELAVEFEAPGRPAAAAAAIPLINLGAVTEQTGGTLAGEQTLYYAVSAVDASGGESLPSFTVRADIPAGTSTNRVRLRGLSFSALTAGFHVYRGPDPYRMARVAADQTPGAEFVDAGLAAGTTPPPDASYDHANFYWRLETLPETAAGLHSANTIGNAGLGMVEQEHRGAVARITRGKGAGQERRVLSNTTVELTVAPPWTEEPDGTSRFVVAESGWRFGCLAVTGPAVFEIPNRAGATVQISGRSANVHDRECAYELSPLARHRTGGATGPATDEDVAGEPVFGLYAAGDGAVELQSVSFQELDNTRTIAAGTLTLHCWDELAGAPGAALAAAAGADDEFVVLSQACGTAAGGLAQVDAELMEVLEVLDSGTRLRVGRGSHCSTAAAHTAGAKVYALEPRVYVVAFPRDFFGSPASGSFRYPILMPDARIGAAELFVTNSRGDSPAARQALTGTTEQGLRTLSGGEITLQTQGPLAIQNDAAPPLTVAAAHSVRDVFATVNGAPQGGRVAVRVRQGGATYCEMGIEDGDTVSNVVNGFGLPPLEAGAILSLDVTGVPQDADSVPGWDLTVTIRL